MSRALLPVLFAALCGACDSTEPSIATSIAFNPEQLSFDATGIRDVISATVLDQRGRPMRNVPVTWSVVGAAVTIIPLGQDSAQVRSEGNGTAVIRASAEGLAEGQLSATVTQAPTSLSVADVNLGRAMVGTALPKPVQVIVRDRMGYGVAGIAIHFEVAEGNGSLSASTVESGSDGVASVIWTLGLTQLVQKISVSAEGVDRPLVVSTTATPGPPHTVFIAGGDGQSGPTGGDLSVAPSIIVLDEFGNPVADVVVTFQVTSGGGAAPSTNYRTGADGKATVGFWRLGPQPGANTLRAQLPSSGLSATFIATALSRLHMEVSAGGDQVARAGTVLPINPSVVIRNQQDEPIPGVAIDFSVREGGGSLSTFTAVTDANGVASPGTWKLGPNAARNRILASATAPLLMNRQLAIDAFGCTAETGGGYGITLCYLSNVPISQRRVFEGAAALWGDVVVGDLPDVDVSLSDPCGARAELETTIDDLLIFVSVLSFDGAGGLLGQAGPCRIRSSSLLPYVGVMQFDNVDVDQLEGSGFLDQLILHEMAHVMGFGTLWGVKSLLVDPSSENLQRDTYFSGRAAIAAFDALGGLTYTAGPKVPVENTGGGGTHNGHWRETVFGRELMTGFLQQGANPLSLISLRSLEDMGYSVDPGRAQHFVYAPQLRTTERAAQSIPLGNDILQIPLWLSDGRGREVRIR